MRGLQDIVADNRRAVEQGVAEPGTLVGTVSIKPKLYNVVRVSDGFIVDRDKTLAQTAEYRELLNTGVLTLVDAD